jgi:hypothetical protein
MSGKKRGTKGETFREGLERRRREGLPTPMQKTIEQIKKNLEDHGNPLPKGGVMREPRAEPVTLRIVRRERGRPRLVDGRHAGKRRDLAVFDRVQPAIREIDGSVHETCRRGRPQRPIRDRWGALRRGDTRRIARPRRWEADMEQAVSTLIVRNARAARSTAVYSRKLRLRRVYGSRSTIPAMSLPRSSSAEPDSWPERVLGG